LKVDRLDDKSQRWAHSVDIFIHDPLDNSRFARIVESAARSSARASNVKQHGTDSISTRISLSFNRAFRSIESIFQDMNLCQTLRCKVACPTEREHQSCHVTALQRLQIKSVRNRVMSLQVPIKHSKTTAIPHLPDSLPNLL
jgi:hypothetical protein